MTTVLFRVKQNNFSSSFVLKTSCKNRLNSEQFRILRGHFQRSARMPGLCAVAEKFRRFFWRFPTLCALRPLLKAVVTNMNSSWYSPHLDLEEFLKLESIWNHKGFCFWSVEIWYGLYCDHRFLGEKSWNLQPDLPWLRDFSMLRHTKLFTSTESEASGEYP